MSYADVRAISVSEIPVIDIGQLAAGDREERLPVAQSLRQASSEIGFFYVKNHGVAEDIIRAADRAARGFFAYPLEEKLRARINRHHRGFLRMGEAKMYKNARVDLKESFIWGLEIPDDDPDRRTNPFLGPNVWPDFTSGFQDALYPFYLSMTLCAKRLMRAFALSLNLPDELFVELSDKPISRSAIIHYPPQPENLGQEQFGVAPHTDYGCLTLLWQDRIGGLEVQTLDGEWVTAHPIPGTLVVNIGDLLSRWTNDKFVSTPHRVVNRANIARHSMTLAFDPNYETVVDSSQTCLPGETGKYTPVRCGDYIQARFDAAFAYRAARE